MKAFMLAHRAQVKRIMVLLIIGLYTVLATYNITFPAIHYDEALYVNAALGGVDTTTFITARIGDLPTLLMPYIGALKSWLFSPIFALFGVSAVSMRLPAVLLSVGALYLLFRMLQRRIGWSLSVSILLVTAINASFIIFTRLDFGPVVIDLLLKIIALWLLLRFVDTPTTRTLVLFWVTLAVGEFNKLNFLWYVAAFTVAFGAVYYKTVFAKLKPQLKKQFALISACGLTLCIGYYLYITTTYQLSGNFAFVGFDLLYRNLQTIVDGSWFYGYAFATQPVGSPIVFWLMAIPCIAGGVLLLPKWRSKHIPLPIVRLFGFLTVFLVVLLAQMAITKAATAGWHYFSIFPIWQILFVLSLYVIGVACAKNNRRIILGVSAFVVAPLSIYNVAVYSTYIQAFDKPTANIGWSPAFYKLLDFTRSLKGRFISLDWGTHVPLQALDPVPGKYTEVFAPLDPNDPAQAQAVYEKHLAGTTFTYCITHPAEKSVFKNLDTAFLTIAQKYGYTIQAEYKISDGDQHIFTVYRLGLTN